MIAPNTLVGGRYRVIRVLGGGGMKLVYLAADQRLSSRPCALAEMVDTFSSPDAQQNAIASFEREADMLARLNNEHIPRVIDRFSEANHHYLVMEYIDGTTLEDEITRGGGKLAPERVIDVAIQVLETLEYLHGLTPPVIYRDLKPSNVMITRDGRVKLIDFGIARFFAPLSNATMIGTQGYAPPEQYRGKVEARSDLYALGATMHHALSGRDPATEPPFSFPPLRKVAPEISSGLAAAVDQALAYDVNRRIADAAEFRRRLVDLRAAPPAAQPATTTPSMAQPTPNSARTQLQLPLGHDNDAPRAGAETASPAPPPSSAPTVVTANPEIRCPQCARIIPAGSRFCSYCAAPLSSDANSGARPTDATVILSPADQAQAEFGFKSAGRPERRGRRSRARRHRSWFFVGLILMGSFLVMRQLARTIPEGTPPADYDSPPPARPVVPEPEALSPVARFRLLALREALDAYGYNTVKLRLHGNLLVLSGTIPSEEDRLTVQQLCLLMQFQYVNDNLRVATPSG